MYEATARFQKVAGPPMVWSRAGWAGSQRYPIGGAAIRKATGKASRASIRGGLSWGMSGTPFTLRHRRLLRLAPAGAELYVRWLQWSVFSSHMRMHGIGEREPWAFGAEAEAIATQVAARFATG